jgi:signal transduction histidine kinase
LSLLDNACRYTPASGEIAIALDRRDADAIVTVSDSGMGIPADELALVQDRFYRGSNAAGMAPQGAGLGLHLARSIVAAHGGDLQLESELGQGTTVRVRLPLLNQPESDQ